jgi:hypothetical protein
MPAETHQLRDHLDAADISELFATVLGLPEGATDRTPLAELGVGEDLVLFDLWGAAAEEYGERALGEPDLDELRAATTVADLARLVAQRFHTTGDHEATDHPGVL